MRPLTPTLPEFGELGCRALVGSENQVQSLLDAKVSGTAKKVLPGVGTFLLLTCVFDAMATGALNVSGLVVTLLSAVVVIGIGEALRRGTIPPRLANAATSFATAAVLIEALARLFYAPAARPTIHVLVLMIGASATVLSYRWLMAVVAASIGSWFLAAFFVAWPSERSLVLGLTSLCLAGVLAVFVHRQRLVAYRSRFQKNLEEAQRNETLTQIQSRYESAVRGANDGLWFWDLAARRVFVSARWMQMVGHPDSSGATQLRPDEWFDTIDPYYVDSLKSAIESHLEGRSAHLEYKHRIQRLDGTYGWVFTRGLATREPSGRAASIAGSMTDISHVMDIEQRLVQDALQDKLTGLANRHSLMIELQAAADRSAQSRKPIGVVFIDLDDFKLVNDSLGHHAGDQLLTQVAQKLFVCRRPGDTLARYGGDEFVLLLEDLANPDEAEEIGRRMQQVLSASMEVNGHSIKVTASVGIAHSNASWRHDELIRNADIAMYQAKAAGQGQLRVFNSDMYDEARRSWELHNLVHGLVDRQECSLCYQPIVSARSGEIAGVEALFRWRSPNNQRRRTIDLIVAAEHTGSIVEIGQWVLGRACAEAAAWHRRGLPAVPISINISAHQLRLPDFVQHVANILREERLSPELVELELTETAFMQDLSIVCSNLEALVNLGVGLAVDDFGTGFSSLSYLAKFPLRTLKIDGSFVSGIGVDFQTESLTKGIISLAHSLGLSVTAEKVETEKQLEFLTKEGCDRVQGFLASAPLGAQEFAEVLRAENKLLATIPLAPRLVRKSLPALPRAVVA